MSERRSRGAVVIPFPTHRRGVVTDLAGLLSAFGCEDIEELSDIVDDDSDPDMWVAESDGVVEVGSGILATLLAFPFPLAEFWAVVDEMEQQEIRHIEQGCR